MEKISEKWGLLLGKLGVWTYNLKWFVWGRKIEEMLYHLTEEDPALIPEYLKKCAYYRRKFLKTPLTPVEKTYEGRIEKYFEMYKIK